jgi:hypothetical protein
LESKLDPAYICWNQNTMVDANTVCLPWMSGASFAAMIVPPCVRHVPTPRYLRILPLSRR